jgi:hypothetical protein
MERTPPSPSKRAKVAMKWDEKNDEIAHRRIVAGREILRNYRAKQQFASHRFVNHRF